MSAYTAHFSLSLSGLLKIFNSEQVQQLKFVPGMLDSVTIYEILIQIIKRKKTVRFSLDWFRSKSMIYFLVTRPENIAFPVLTLII